MSSEKSSAPLKQEEEEIVREIEYVWMGLTKSIGELGSCMPRHAAREKKKGWVRQESRLTQAWGRGREKVIFTRTRKSQRRPDLKKERNSRLPSGHAGLRGLWNHVDGSQVARTEGQRGH